MPTLYQLWNKRLLFEGSSPTSVITNAVGMSPSHAETKGDKLSGAGSTTFATMASTLNLCPSSPPAPTQTDGQPAKAEDAPKHPSYVFSGAYAPLIARLMEVTAAEGWNEAKLRKALGSDIPLSSTNPTKPDNRIRKALLVCFIGGITYAEVAALRCFAQSHDFRVIMVATSVIHREEFLKGAAEF